MERSIPGRLLFLRGRWLWATLAVLAGAALFVRLGFWQLQRLEQRRANNAFMLARLGQPPVELTGQPVDSDALDLRRAAVRGTYDFSQEIVLRNRALNGSPGVHLITPLRISGSTVALLVDRGWVPYDRATPDLRKGFDAPAGEVEVQGLIHRSQIRLNTLSPADPPLSPDRPRLDEWFRVDVPRIQQQIPYPLLPVFVEEGDPRTTPTAATDVLPYPDAQVDLSEGPHLSYAIQWFAFCLILLGGYALYLRHQGRI